MVNDPNLGAEVDSVETAPEGETSSTVRSRKAGWLKWALTSTNSTNSTNGSMVRLVVTVVGVPDDDRSGIGRLMTLDSEVISLKSPTLVQPGARSTAALASTMPKPYSWLKL